MINAIRKVFKDNCKHPTIKKTDRKIIEHKCDCCNKVLYLNEENDYTIHPADALESTTKNIYDMRLKGK